MNVNCGQNLFLLCAFIGSLGLHAQAGHPVKQAPFAITNAGNSAMVAGNSYAWSVGEVVIFTGFHGSGFATQGFHQPMICRVIPQIIETNQTNCFAPYTLQVADGFSKYQWYHGRSIISNARNSIYYPVKNGNYYVFVGDSTGCFYTTTAVNVDLSAKNIKPNLTVSGNVNADTLLSTAPAASYQWYVIGTDGVHRAIVDATNASYRPLFVGSYYVKINTSDNCVAYSDPYLVSNNTLDPLNRYSFDMTDSTIRLVKQKPSDKIYKHKLLVYPNPTQADFVYVAYESPEKNHVHIKMYNIHGVEVSAKTVKNSFGKFETKYERNDLPVGKYIINIVDGDKQFVQSVVFE